MLTEEILKAIREQPENVEWFSKSEDKWISLNKVPFIALVNAVDAQWRIKPKPYEARHEIWLSDTPDPIPEKRSIGGFLFGEYVMWCKTAEITGYKKFEIIIREVVE